MKETEGWEGSRGMKRRKGESERGRKIDGEWDVSAHSIFRVFLFCLRASQTKVLPELAARYSPDQLEPRCQMEKFE